ncbi:MAG: hypothetical protein GY856_30615 [bacterium]|nr:hypothetical protein [bacterium]
MSSRPAAPAGQVGRGQSIAGEAASSSSGDAASSTTPTTAMPRLQEAGSLTVPRAVTVGETSSAPSAGVLVEVSSRTVNAWALMRPCAELSDVTVGVLGRSLELAELLFKRGKT